MEVISIRDLTRKKALAALKRYRRRYYNESVEDEELENVYKLVGGRLSYLNRVAQAKNMMRKAIEICENERIWLLTQCGILGSAFLLGPSEMNIYLLLIFRSGDG